MTSATELQTWLTGTATGGPNSDGRYPLTDSSTGLVHLVYCPAAQALNPSLATQPIETFANTASAAATTATTQATSATQAKTDAQTAAANALTSETNALASKNTATTQAATATTKATEAATSATNAATSATNANTAKVAAEAAAASFTAGDYVRKDGTVAMTATLQLNSGGNVAAAKAGATLDHAYLSWYPRSASPSLRCAWMGYGSAGANSLQIVNEIAGGGITITATTGNCTINAGSTILSGALQATGNMVLPPTVGVQRTLEIGTGRTDDFGSFIDMGGDSTYTDFGLRLQRNAGANGGANLQSRGTGTLSIQTNEAGALALRTNSLTRFQIDGTTGAITLANGAYVANGWAMDGLVTAARRMTWKGGGVARMDFGMDGGDNVIMNVFDDAGASLGKAWSVTRLTRVMDFGVMPTVAGVAMASASSPTISNPTFTGTTTANGNLISATGGVYSKATAGNNAHLWMQDEAGLAQGLVFWDRAADSVKVRRYNAAGSASEGQIEIGATATTFTTKLVSTDATDVRMDLPGRNGSGMANLQLNYSTAGNVGFYDNVAGAWRFRVDVNGLVSVTHIPDLATSKITGLDAALTGKQAASANLTSWSALAPAAKQDALGYTPVNKAGDTLTGALTVPGDGNPASDLASLKLTGSFGGGIKMVDGSFTAKIYADTVGGGKVNIWGSTAGVIMSVKDTTSYDAVSINGGMQSLGTTAQLGFANRTGGQPSWVWYSDAGIARLWNGSDRFQVNGSGDVFGNTFSPASANGVHIKGNGSGLLFEGSAGTYSAGIHNVLSANGAAWVRIPRIFIGGSDPGAQASDGDIWIP